jgi:hypothetical protein
MKKITTKHKTLGQVFTPDFNVEEVIESIIGK